MWAIDADQGFVEKQNLVLLKMGKYMEKMLQSPAKEFRGRYLIKEDKTGSPTEQDAPDYYNYSKTGQLLLRS